MRHALTYSLISHLQSQVPEVGGRVTWIFDGVNLTGTEKPFLTIEAITDSNELLAAGRRDFAEVYAWQIGLRARSMAERERLTDTVRTVLRQRDIPFIDTRGPTPLETDQTFVADVIRAVPIPADDPADETDRHRVYIDVEVRIYRVNGDGINFSQ